MPPRFAAYLVLLAAVTLAACKGEPESTAASPSPTASTSVVSLAGALPSPTPDARLPSMPPEVAGSFVFYEDFEKGMARWKITGGAGPVGWHLLKAATCGGLFTMVLGEAKNPPTRYAKGEAYLTLVKPIDLRKARAAQLQYDVKGVADPPGAATVVAELRVPGGAWQAITPPATARFQLVVSYTADLTPWLGKQVELRFRGTTAPARTPNKGFYLDDVHVVEAQKR